MFLTLQEFDDPKISYGFFGRQGGVSSSIFSSLNTSFVSGDDVEDVTENRRRISSALQIGDISSPFQFHSAECLVLASPLTVKAEGDALVTSVPGVAIGIQTADCGPVLFYGESSKGPVIGAAHAGWGGALKGVLENTIQKMIGEGARLETIRAAVGPCIGQDSYEVSEGFQAPFFEEDRDSIMYFKPGAPDKLWFNLPGYIKFRLARAGINQISVSWDDTYKDEENYFSFRRATHNGEKQYGRELSVISIR